MRLKVIVPGPERPVFEVGVTCASEDASPLSGQAIPKGLTNSDEHLMWQVYHAQTRFGLRRISRIDNGKPCAAVLKPAGFRTRLKWQVVAALIRPLGPSHPI